MARKTTLTQSPVPLLDDPANIELALSPGLHHLEKYSIPRFATVTQRNNAYRDIPREQGMMCYVHSLREYHVWDGDSWVEFAQWSEIRPVFVEKMQTQRTNATNGTIVSGFALPLTRGRWRFEALLIHNRDGTGPNQSVSTGIRYNFLFPNNSRGSLMYLGRGADESPTEPENSNRVNLMAGRNVTEAGMDRGEFGLTTRGTYAKFEGIMQIRNSGTARVRMYRLGPSGGVAIRARSYMMATKVG